MILETPVRLELVLGGIRAVQGFRWSGGIRKQMVVLAEQTGASGIGFCLINRSDKR